MHKFASLNHRIKSVSEIILPAVSSAAFYGKSVFTTAAIYHGKPFQWENHWRRLSENAAQIGVDLSDFSEAQVKDSLLELISENDFQNGRARLTFFDESAGGIWSDGKRNKTTLLITAADFKAVSENFRLTVSPFSTNSKSPLAGIKSGNYLENILALEDAKKNGFDEAVRLNENGEIVSAVMANIFWVSDGKIFTPPISSGALPGTTRSFVIRNFPVAEKKAALEELRAANEIFITSAGISIVTVKSFQEKMFETSFAADRIREVFNDSIRR